MKRIGLIALALVLSLGLMGAGLAYWSETLTINGTVATGTFDMEFTGVSCTDPDGTVAKCDIDVSGPDGDSNVDEGIDGITIDISNGYPCYEPFVYFTVHNCGTIPAKVSSMTMSDANSLFSLTYAVAGASSVGIASGSTIFVDLGTSGVGPDGVWDLCITYTGDLSGTLDASGGAHDAVPCTLDIHVCEEGDEGNDATENASGKFAIAIDTTQFNA